MAVIRYNFIFHEEVYGRSIMYEGAEVESDTNVWDQTSDQLCTS